MRPMKKVLIWLVLIAAIAFAGNAAAEGFTVTRLPQDAELQPVNGVYVLKESGSYAAYGMASDMRIEVDGDVTLILSGAQMMMQQEGAAPVHVRPGAELTLVLADGTINALHAGNGAAGLQIDAGSSVVIRCQKGAGHACTDDCGHLDVQGGDAPAEENAPEGGEQTGSAGYGAPGDVYEAAAGAGIGGGAGRTSGTIIIESGKIDARGGSSGNITGGAPGVGGGGNTEKGAGTAHSGSITITGGIVQAQGAVGAAGIGGGDWGGEGRNITISGGMVLARGGDGAAGIGGGFLGEGKNIRISGGSVLVYGGEEASGIGGGYAADGKELVVSGGRVQAHAGAQYAYPRPNQKPQQVSPVNDAIGSGAEAKTSQLSVSPQYRAIAVRCGTAKVDAVELLGSPFVTTKDITQQVDDAGFVEMWEMDGDQWVIDQAGGNAGNGEHDENAMASVPVTGDQTPLVLWLALVLLSAAGMLLLGKRTFANKG